MNRMDKSIIIFLITALLMLLSLDSHAINVASEIKLLAKNPSSIENWGLKKIDTEKSWQLSRGNKNIIVAIIDTGMDVNHPALKNNLWTNPNEIPDNKIDDDKNGFVDDIHGWNFVNETNKPFDNHGHGTHIAGIIHNVAPEVSFMILKYFDPHAVSDTNITNTVKAINYAVKNGAHIINYSGGGFGKNSHEESAIESARAQDIIIVAAAGNDKVNADRKGFYPASYKSSNIISVASFTSESELVSSSNFGVRTVDIAAPGKDIYSTLPNGRYGYMTGTSQATAFVTGVVSILLDSRPDIKTSEKIIEHIAKTGILEKNLQGKTKYQTKLNSYRALTMKDSGVNAQGLMIENTKQINSDIFSSDVDVVQQNLDSIIKSMGQRSKIRIPAQE